MEIIVGGGGVEEEAGVTHIVQFEVEAAGVANRVPVRVPPPQCRRCGLTVRARRPRTPGCGLHNDRGGSHMTTS